jgi:iron(III) transport system substrate-binding protein
MKTLLKAAAFAFASTLSLASAQVPAGYPAGYAQTVAAAKREGKVVVYSVLSNKAAQPLIRDFNALYPGIKVEYDGEGGSTETYDRFLAETAAGQGPDVMWSSAMDLQLKLVEDGHAMTYASPEAPRLPKWAVYKHQAYGTTFEPVVFIYNKQQVRGEEIPRDHAAFARLLRADAGKFKGKVTAFDIEKSGVGFMFAVQDRAQYAGMKDFLGALGAAEYRASPGTGAMLEKVTSGEYLLGYNIMGAYALVRSKKEPSLGVVLPSDYTLVLSRVAFIGKRARNPNAARLWVDYMLSPRGQKVIGDSLELFTIRTDVDAEYTAAKLARDIGPNARPIPLDASVTTYLDPKKHAEFVADWNSAIAAGRRAAP